MYSKEFSRPFEGCLCPGVLAKSATEGSNIACGPFAELPERVALVVLLKHFYFAASSAASLPSAGSKTNSHLSAMLTGLCSKFECCPAIVSAATESASAASYQNATNVSN